MSETPLGNRRCIVLGCCRLATNGRCCAKHATEHLEAMLDLRLEERERFVPGDIPIALEDDWRASVMRSSRLPTGIRIDPEGSAALRYMRDGRSGKLPVAIYEEPQLSEPTEGTDFGMTLDEIAEELDIHRERARQIIEKALRKLRHPSRSKRLVQFLEP